MKNIIKICLIPILLLFYCSKAADQKKPDKTKTAEQVQSSHTHDDGEEHTHETTSLKLKSKDVEQQSGSLDHDHLHVSAEVIKKRGIKTANPQLRAFVEKASLPGVIKQNENRSYLVHSLVSGLVTAFERDIGDRVKKGDSLCVINSMELLEIKKEFISAYLNYLKDLDSFRSAQKLILKGGIKKREYFNREVLYKSSLSNYLSLRGKLLGIGLSRALLNQVQDALRTSEEKLIQNFHTPFFTLRSPGNGIVLSRNLKLGEHLETEKMLFNITDSQRPWALFNAKEKDLIILKSGAEIYLTSDSYPNQRFFGKIVKIYRSIDPVIRTVKIRATVENEDNLLKPEMFVVGYYSVNLKKNTLAVPKDALVKVFNNNGVFVREVDGFKFTPVKLIDIDYDGYAFIEGIKKEDKVVIKGAFYLKAEQEIQSGSIDPHAGHEH